MTLVLFLISSAHSLAEFEEVCVFTGLRATFGKETAQLQKSHSTSVPVNGLGKVLETPLLIMADQIKQQASFQSSRI